MTGSGSRVLPSVLLAVVTAVAGVLLFGHAGRYPVAAPLRTSEVAAATSGPRTTRPPQDASAIPLPTPGAGTMDPGEPSAPPATDGPRVTDAPAQTPGPSDSDSPTGPSAPTPQPSTPVEQPLTGLQPGSVDRSSLDLSATYDVNAELTVGTGDLDVATTLVVRNDGASAIDRLDLNTVAARLGRLHITGATVDDRRVKVRVEDQTLRVPLGGLLQPGVTTTVRISYRATLRLGISGSDWMFSRYGGTIALYRWIPWLSRAVPFDRPNTGDPFVTLSSPEVSVELLTDQPLVLAAPSADVAQFVAGSGKAWAFTLKDVRDVAVVLAPDLAVRRDKVDGVSVLAYSAAGDFAAQRLLDLTTLALREEQRVLGVEYPWPALVAVEMPGGEAMESPGQIWIPRNLDSLNRTYLVHHEVAHQWFYGLVGNDQRLEPFLDEATADQLARTAMGSFRATRCSRAPLDGSIARYQGRCYYEVVYVQGGLFLDDVRARIGTNRYWKAMAEFVAANRFGVAKTRDLLDALESAEPDGVNLRPLFRERFPSLY